MDINEILLDARFKDARPMDTVEKVQSILCCLGIETEEQWSDTAVPYCHSLSVQMKGTSFRVNGKGLSREFALASGYGELSERSQLGYIGALEDQKTGGSVSLQSYARQHMDDLLRSAPSHYQALSQRLEQIMGISMTPEAILRQFADPQGQIPCVPCYELTQRKTVWFPNRIRTRGYGSNGCAAGNTIEEAIVQGLSEVVERHVQSQINLQGLTPPDVPEEVLRRFPTAYEIITYVRSQGYQVLIKDCSMGTGFPVICACLIHRQTGRYHTHFGAYPILEIAVERALTESFQGRDIHNVADMTDLICDNTGLTPLECLTGEFFKGVYKKPASFFVGPASYPYDPKLGFDATSNEALLGQCVDHFARLGHQILVYDRSLLGFPTCQVRVPGYSEVFVDRLCNQKDHYRYSGHAIRALRCPTKATTTEMLGLLIHLDQMERLNKDDRLSRGFLNAANLCADLDGAQQQRLMNVSLAYIYLTLGREAEAIGCIDRLLPGSPAEDVSYLTALKRYLTMKQSKQDPTFIRQTLEIFHGPEITDALYDHLQNGPHPLDRFTLHCRLDCGEDCPLFGRCHKAYQNQLSALIDDRMKHYDPAPHIQRLDHILQK